MAGTTTPIRTRLAQIASTRSHARQVWVSRFVAMAVMATASGALVDAAAAVRDGRLHPAHQTPTQLALPKPAPEPIIEWIGQDIDGDGAPDFINPTGQAPRTHDAYGYGHFGASRDGGGRHHKGVDFTAEAGQDVLAPISGYVTRIGYAYSGKSLRYVEISNPALNYKARVFYVKPSVQIGQSVRLGDRIGALHSLQPIYPGGMTDHVHLELKGPSGRAMDATEVIVAEVVGYRTPRA